MSFVNTLPYISNPIEEFGNYKFVSWERDIYPILRGKTKQEEVDFYVDLITQNNLKNILDFGVGGGNELANIVEALNKKNYAITSAEANELDEEFIKQAGSLFKAKDLDIPIHVGNWVDLPEADPPYTHKFDFGFLTGNSLTYVGGGSREYTKKAQQSIVHKFAQMIESGGYIFIDSRNYDYIRSLTNLPKEEIFKGFSFANSVYYHGFPNDVLVFPAYISETVVVLHYYSHEKQIWGKLDLYPVYEEDIVEILNQDFEIKAIYHDFEAKRKKKSLFKQYLARKK